MKYEMNYRFWFEEIPLRLRGWWRRHWWPARIKQLDRERQFWKAQVLDALPGDTK